MTVIMTIIFWIMVLLTGLCAFAASLITKNGAWIFFAGYFLATGLCAIVGRYQELQKRQGGES